MALKSPDQGNVVIFWFRRDLRLEDNAGLYHALKENNQVLPLFIFDSSILSKLSDQADPRVNFIHEQILLLNEQLLKIGSSLLVRLGEPAAVISQILKEFTIEKVYTNHDYEPYAIERDERIKILLSKVDISFKTFKDQVIFEKDEVQGDGGKNYKVYTPYKNKWLKNLNDFFLKPYPTEKYFSSFLKIKSFVIPTLEAIGFQKSKIQIPSKSIVEATLANYGETRNFPAKNSTSKLGIHLRFGTLSIRYLAALAKSLDETWLSELIWREFFMQLLYHNPAVVDHPFNPRFNKMKWRHNEQDFQKWCEGKTGYPLVDAGMRELNATYYMHNRVRLVVASFLTKHLLIDWKWGEAYFSQKLLDYELASNNGNWQWSAGTGADAQPFFRIFNPTLQQERFDPKFEYIKKWVPEFGNSSYPKPMVDHKEAVTRAKVAFGILNAG